MEKDEIFELAERYVTCTGKSVFLTGKAGTGKTTFLKHLTSTTTKRFVVLAPTGVAAINAGGSTIHSFFQLPLCPYLPDVKELITEYQTPERYRSLRKERVKIIRTLDLLIIDEISMVRADLLDAVDMTLRRYRRNDRPFGGVQLLMIGDAQQLSPVVKENERPFMAQVYPSPYFFHAKALQNMEYVTIELQKVYRQKDRDFLDVLNAVRENRITADVLKVLNSRVHAYEDDEDTIRLTTHNAQADAVNLRKLEMLPDEVKMFEADIEGDFPENSYPADFVLSLKVGAQVMFIRNDSEGEYYNGKIGKVEEIDDKGIIMVSDNEGNMIAVTPVEWENIQYTLDEQTGEIMPSVLGKFRQIPLKIAWAITIHKSQGLTFDRVIIDAGAAFAFGQVYVALSRCRSLEGISLDSPISYSAICSDTHVSQFNSAMPDIRSVSSRISYEEKGYLFDTLRIIFDLEELCKALGWLRKSWRGTIENIYEAEYQGLIERVAKTEELKATTTTFRRQLDKIEAARLDDDSFLKERLVKASGYFLPVLTEIRNFCQDCAELEIDNKETKKRIKEASDEVLTILDIECRTLQMIVSEGFSLDGYNRIRTECLLEDRNVKKAKRLKKIERKPGEAGIVNEELRERLQEWRSERFKQDNVPAYTIMHQSTLMEIATYVPKTKKELLAIKGFGEAKFLKYGEEILKITADYSSTV
ncbi:MAG: AAA family ATPase [Bacteroidales bacterium]|nr:AAA family ATPase [Bacteroidales bacterium]